MHVYSAFNKTNGYVRREPAWLYWLRRWMHSWLM